MSRLPCNQKIDMSVDRGRILPLGGPTASRADPYQKAVDASNPYRHFSRRNPQPSARNDSELTPRAGAMSATGEIAYRGGKRSLSASGRSDDGGSSAAELTPRSGLRMTGMERRIVDLRTYAEDHPRKLVKAVPEPVRPATDEQGRVPFITGNGMIGKFGVSPARAQKNTGTTQLDLDTRNQQKRERMVESGVTPQRYQSPYRAVAEDRGKSPIHAESLPLHPEVAQGGLAKKQRFNASQRRNESSLNGVFNIPERKPPPPYKLVAPFHTSD